MAIRLGLGPVFYYEWVISSRRWQMYVGRSLFVLMLLLALFIVWYTESDGRSVTSLRGSRKLLAELGEKFFYAVIGTQLTLVLLVAPAIAAGAVCVDKARGTLLHLFTTDLTNAEVILGKLATRLLTLLGLVLCTLPVLFLCTLEGGIDPDALFGAFLITGGIVIFTATLALALSVWCSRTYEVLLATYLIIFLILIVNPLWKYWGFTAAPLWLEALNPFWLAFAPYWHPGLVSVDHDFAFLGVCTTLAAVLAVPAVWRVRAIAIHQSSKPARRRGRIFAYLDPTGLTSLLPGFGLDFNPVLWREWHCKQTSRWVRGVWLLYVVLALIFTALAGYRYLNHRSRFELGPFVNAFQVALGLLLVSIGSVTALSEERLRGTMELLLTTTIPSWKIVWGKWWGVYRTVIFLSILPGILGFTIVFRQRFWQGPAILVGLVLAWGAAITSFGLALATWNRRPGRALAYSLIAYVGMTVGWSIVIFLLVRGVGGRGSEGLAIASPWYGSGALTAYMEEQFQMAAYSSNNFNEWSFIGWGVFWIIAYALVAVVFFLLALVSFNVCLGRMPFYPPKFNDALRMNRGGAARASPAARQRARPP